MHVSYSLFQASSYSAATPLYSHTHVLASGPGRGEGRSRGYARVGRSYTLPYTHTHLFHFFVLLSRSVVYNYVYSTHPHFSHTHTPPTHTHPHFSHTLTHALTSHTRPHLSHTHTHTHRTLAAVVRSWTPSLPRRYSNWRAPELFMNKCRLGLRNLTNNTTYFIEFMQ